jgi:stage V sporulation protein D (sporulation-specific penicillin-binding protein)
MFIKHIHSRIKIVLLISVFLFILVILRVFYIQMFQYQKLNTLASALWSRNLPIEANRGVIYDRNGVIIADNVTTTSLILIPNQIKDKEKVSKELAKILNVSYEEMYKHVTKKVSIERVHPEGRRLNYETADKISNLNFDGVYLVKEAKRYYPFDDYLSHVLGFVGIDNQGLSGLELQYDNYLMGENGAIKYFSDAKGERLKMAEVYEQPQDGINVMLTIDHKIQTAVERELDNIVAKYNPDSALIIAMDPNNGEILAMSSRPNFSPNNYQKYTVEEINRNLPIWATYEPGSTFKIITLTAALQENLVDLNKDTYYDTGSVRVENAKIRCWKAGGHGHQTFLEVVENSCNPGFVELGQRLGKDILFSYIDKFGFGRKTGIDLNGEGTGIIFNLDRVGPVELATTSFGQGVSVTPIQQITAVSAAINGGFLYQPYIVKRLLEPETNDIIKENQKTLVNQVIEEKTSMMVRYALESVVAKGTGRPAYIDGYRVGGKTGTAQKVNKGVYMVGNYILSFIGFLPADNPKVVVYVAIDHPRGVVQYGGVVAGPIAKTIMNDCITALNIDKRKGGTELEYNWMDKKIYDVPNVVGMNKKEAIPLLKHFQIEWTGSGNIIIEQSPIAGERIEEGSKVRLLLNEH